MKKISPQTPIQKEPCKSCPFAGSDPIDLEPKSVQEIYRNVVELHGSHICHSVKTKTICIGGRNLTLKVLVAKGLLREPTDAEFERVSLEILSSDRNHQ